MNVEYLCKSNKTNGSLSISLSANTRGQGQCGCGDRDEWEGVGCSRSQPCEHRQGLHVTAEPKCHPKALAWSPPAHSPAPHRINFHPHPPSSLITLKAGNEPYSSVLSRWQGTVAPKRCPIKCAGGEWMQPWQWDQSQGVGQIWRPELLIRYPVILWQLHPNHN